MRYSTSFTFYVQDWLSNPVLRTCSLAAQGLLTNLLALMADAPDPGVLCFSPREDWRFNPRASTNSRKNLAYTPRPKTRKRLEKNQKKTRKKLENLVFAKLEKALSIDRNVIARRLVELYEKGVLSCNDAGFFESGKLKRLAEERRRYPEKYSKNGALKPLLPTIQLTNYNSPIVPSSKEGTGSASIGSQKPKRRRATKTERELRIGSETGGAEKSAAERFLEAWVAAGLPPDKLYEAWVSLGGDYTKIPTGKNGRRQ